MYFGCVHLYIPSPFSFSPLPAIHNIKMRLSGSISPLEGTIQSSAKPVSAVTPEHTQTKHQTMKER